MFHQLTQGQEKQVKRDPFKTVVTAREGKALTKGKERGKRKRNREQDRQTSMERITQGCLGLCPCIHSPASMVSAFTPRQITP